MSIVSKKMLLVCASLMLIACGGEDDDDDGADRDRDRDETGEIGDAGRARDAAVADAGPSVRTDAGIAAEDTRSDGGAILTRGDAGTARPSTPPDDAGANTSSDAGDVVRPDADVSVSAADREICEAASGEPGTCNACVSTECCGETIACLRDAQCTQIMTCVSNCPSGNTSCISACQTRFPGGVTPMQAMADCGLDRCLDACQG